MSRDPSVAPADELRMGPLAARSLKRGSPVLRLRGLGGSPGYSGDDDARVGADSIGSLVDLARPDVLAGAVPARQIAAPT